MLIERGGRPFVFSQIDGPDAAFRATATVEAALVAEGVDPGEADWHAATWQGAEARYQIDTGTVPDGRYVLKWRVTYGSEVVVLTSGRVTVGAATP